ncbi:hypothetical protein HOG21_05035 [bacterium]|nr:hypothetical protein [bacterium]
MFFVIISILETEDIDATASHLNQKVIILYKSSIFLILEVEYFSITKGRSSFSIQSPSSVIVILSIQPQDISIFILFAFASIEFSMSSFIIDTGLSTTSHAAIWFAKFLSSFIIFDIILLKKI